MRKPIKDMAVGDWLISRSRWNPIERPMEIASVGPKRITLLANYDRKTHAERSNAVAVFSDQASAQEAYDAGMAVWKSLEPACRAAAEALSKARSEQKERMLVSVRGDA